MKAVLLAILTSAFALPIGLILFIVAAVAGAFGGAPSAGYVLMVYALTFVGGIAGTVMLIRKEKHASQVLLGSGVAMVGGVCLLALTGDWEQGIFFALPGPGYAWAGFLAERE